MLLLVALLLVIASLVLLVLGFVQNVLGYIYVEMLLAAVAGLVLIFATRLTRRRSRQAAAREVSPPVDDPPSPDSTSAVEEGQEGRTGPETPAPERP